MFVQGSMSRLLVAALFVPLIAACFVDGGTGVAGHVYDMRGNPVRGARVTLQAPGRSAAPDGSAVGDDESRQDGCYYVFGTHAPGRVQVVLTVTAAGFKPYAGHARAGQYTNDVVLAPIGSLHDSVGEFRPHDLTKGHSACHR